MFYGIPTGWSFRELERCLKSIYEFDSEADVVVVNNNPDFLPTHNVLQKFPCLVQSFGHNIGVGAAWNYLCNMAFNQMQYSNAVILNDDIYFVNDHFLSCFAQNTSIMKCELNQFACFAITADTYNMVGSFEQANYAYYEDNDYQYRCRLAGVDMLCLDTQSIHGDGGNGSKTIRNDAFMRMQNDKCFPVAQRHYVAKWGGLPNSETYTTPFNGGEPANGSIWEWEQGTLL